MGELRKLQQALERSQEAKQAKSAVPATKPTRAGGGTQVYPVDGEVPTRWATTGDVVIVCWGDPSLVGGELIDLPAIVTRGESNGRMNAQCVVDPGAVGAGADGRPAAMPPLLPIANCPYSKERRALTWRWREDCVAPPAPMLRTA